MATPINPLLPLYLADTLTSHRSQPALGPVIWQAIMMVVLLIWAMWLFTGDRDETSFKISIGFIIGIGVVLALFLIFLLH